MRTDDKNLPTKNPCSIRTRRLARHFLRSMKKLVMNKRYNVADKHKRHGAIRAAAYASMASAVGRNKAWSRALLGKTRNPKIYHRRRARKVMRGNPRNMSLRELVPGGKSMDICRLLNETGDYIKCLRAQVQVMRKIVDYSASRLSS